MEFRVGEVYKDMRGRKKPNDQYTSWLTFESAAKNQLASVNIYQGVKYLNFLEKRRYPFPVAFIFETSLSSRFNSEFSNPWSDEFIDNGEVIKYWSDAKFHVSKKIHDWVGCKKIKHAINAIEEIGFIPPVLHFTRIANGQMRFNGIYGIVEISRENYLDFSKNKLVENYLVHLKRLDTTICSIDWIHKKLQDYTFNLYPDYWKKYLKHVISNPIKLPVKNIDKSHGVPDNKIGQISVINKFVDNQDFLGLFSYFNSELNNVNIEMNLSQLRDFTVSYFVTN